MTIHAYIYSELNEKLVIVSADRASAIIALPLLYYSTIYTAKPALVINGVRADGARRPQHLFAAATSGLTVFVLDSDTLDPTFVGFYNATATHGEATSVAYNKVYDELAISVAAYDELTQGQVHIISSVEDWIT